MADPDQSTSGPPRDIGLYRSSDLDRSGLVFTPLAGTAAEAKALQGLLKLDVQEVLTGANATEEKLKGLHGPRTLHVATHGFFLSDAGGGRGPSASQLRHRDAASAAGREPDAAFGARPGRGQRAALWRER
ncbi:CHAT domain-containing protein [Bradyrhizobium sp. S3.12.5]